MTFVHGQLRCCDLEVEYRQTISDLHCPHDDNVIGLGLYTYVASILAAAAAVAVAMVLVSVLQTSLLYCHYAAILISRIAGLARPLSLRSSVCMYGLL